MAPTSRPRFSNTSTYSISGRASSRVVRSAQRSTTLRTCGTGQRRQRLAVIGREEHDFARAGCGNTRRGSRGLRRVERRSARRARTRASGWRTNARRRGRVLRDRRRRTGNRSRAGSDATWRAPTMFTHSRVSGSKRSSPAGSDITPYWRTPAVSRERRASLRPRNARARRGRRAHAMRGSRTRRPPRRTPRPCRPSPRRCPRAHRA